MATVARTQQAPRALHRRLGETAVGNTVIQVVVALIVWRVRKHRAERRSDVGSDD